jgi:hypothetical protein
MSKFRRAAKVDANQGEIVKELRGLGYSVELDHDDILVGYRGRTFWYEIKTGPKAVVKESQKRLVAQYKGHYKIVWSTEMILADIKKEMNDAT